MVEDFFELCKKNDRGLRTALGETRRIAILGQINREEQDYYLIGLDRKFLSDITSVQGFLLTVKKDKSNITFDAYLDFVEDMFSIGHLNLTESADELSTQKQTLPTIEAKLNAIELTDNQRIKLSELQSLLSEKEQWFLYYLTGSRWSFEAEDSFYKRELVESVNLYKSIISLIKEYNLTKGKEFS